MIMLDFYLVSDDESIPEYPNESAYVDSISWEEHEHINNYFLLLPYKKKQPLLHYYEDNHFNLLVVNEIRSLIPNIGIDTLNNASIEKFSKILKLAIDKEMGLVTFCD